MREAITTAINGTCGRMGQRLLALAHEDPELRVVAALEARHHAQIGRDAGEVAGIGPIGVLVRDELPISTQVDVMIDFSSPEGTMAILPTCVARRIPLLIATTGHNAVQRRHIDEAMHETAILMTANTSLAVNVLLKLVRIAGEALAGKGFDVEIIEKHPIASRRMPHRARRCSSRRWCGRRWGSSTCGMAAKAWSGSDRWTRSVSTPSALATTSANIPSSSAP
jgi:4-hydroxy-tetrahydrodipicolinate reductase